MKQPIIMPTLSDTMDTGRLSRWTKQPGDRVRKGDSLAEVETDKAIMDVEAFHDGFLAGPLAPTDQDIKVGQPIGYIVDSLEQAHGQTGAMAPPAVSSPTPAAQTLVTPIPPPIAPTTARAGSEKSSAFPRQPATGAPAISASATARVASSVAMPSASPITLPTEASPVLAAGLGQFSARPGAEPASPVTDNPVFSIPASPLASAEAATNIALEQGPAYTLSRTSALREAVARNMAATTATPTFHVSVALPLGVLRDYAKTHSLSLTLLLCRACAHAIRRHPDFNAIHTPAGLARRDRIDIGVALDRDEGLITPVLRDVAHRPLADLAADWTRLRAKVESRRLLPADYQGATFYVSDLGVFPEVLAFDSLVPAGSSAILSIAAIQPDGNAIGTLGCDHRVVFGADAARFLQTLIALLDKPALLSAEDKSP